MRRAASATAARRSAGPTTSTSAPRLSTSSTAASSVSTGHVTSTHDRVPAPLDRVRELDAGRTAREGDQAPAGQRQARPCPAGTGGAVRQGATRHGEGSLVAAEQLEPASRAAVREHGDTRAAERLDVAQDGPRGHLELAGQLGRGDLPAVLQEHQQGHQSAGAHIAPYVIHDRRWRVCGATVRGMADTPEGNGTKDDPWILSTPPGSSQFEAWREPEAEPPALVVQVGSTQLRYHLRAIDDLHAMLKDEGDWVPLGNADEQKEAKAGTVEAWARSADNPVGGWYGLKKGLPGPVRQLRAAGHGGAGPGRGRARRPQQPHASRLTASARGPGHLRVSCPLVGPRPSAARSPARTAAGPAPPACRRPGGDRSTPRGSRPAPRA